MEVHIGMRDKRFVIFISQTDIIQLHILDSDNTAHRIGLLLLFRTEGIHEELVIPGAVWQTVHIRHHILQPHMGEAYLAVPERQWGEMGERFAYKRQRVSLLIRQVYIPYGQPGGKTVFHRTHLRLRAERARELRRGQLHSRRLHFGARQSSHDHSAHQQQGGSQNSQYVQHALHICVLFAVQIYSKICTYANKNIIFSFFPAKILPYQKKAVPLHAFSTSKEHISCLWRLN